MRVYMLLATALTAAALPGSQLEHSNNLEARVASCTSSKGKPNRVEIEALSKDLQNNNPNEQVGLNRRKQLTFTLGSSRICVANDFIFENTHVKRSDIGRGALNALNRCCRGGTCQGTAETIFGDSGLSLRLFIADSNWPCDK